MKKITVALFAIAALLPATVLGGGIVTNTNQSASFIRMPSLDAFLGIEGTYYNPAGLTHLQDGFYLSLSNQTISQSREVNSTFTMNRQEFLGEVSAPLFPTFYAVYKYEKVAFSLGVNPIGGGGSAGFAEGLPSFEQQVAVLPSMLTASGIPTTQYSVNSNFDATSLYWGIQVNGSYAVNEMISVSLGLRYISAKNTYTGYLKDIMINPNQPAFGAAYNGTSLVSAPQFFTDASTTLGGWAAGANAYFAGLQLIVDGGGGALTLEQAQAATLLNATQVAQIQGLITAAGQNPTGVNVATAQAILGAAAPVFTANSAVMAGYSTATSDKEVDAAQTGFGIAPIFGINLKFSEKLNVAIKYEHKAPMTLTNETVIDGTNMFLQGAKTPNDMPSLFTFGVAFKPMEKLNVTGGFHMYFDKKANYGKKLENEDGDMVFVENTEVMDGNSIEAALGLEYSITDKILVSAGYLMTKTGANDDYQSDMSHSLNSNSIGLGGKYQINESFGVNLGFMTTMYKGYTKTFTPTAPMPEYTEEYNRSAMVIGVGVDYKF